LNGLRKLRVTTDLWCPSPRQSTKTLTHLYLHIVIEAVANCMPHV